MKKIVLFGGGGHCKSCIDVIETENKFEILGIVNENNGSKKSILGYPVLGFDKDAFKILNKSVLPFISIGQIKSPNKRK